jgi:large subunit ribosomal protein L6
VVIDMTTQATPEQKHGRRREETWIHQSRVGKRPVALPKGVSATLKNERSIEVKGPKGTLGRDLPAGIKLKVDAAGVAVIPTALGRDGARYQGLARSLIRGMVIGVAEGYTKTLQLVGTGYRAEIKGQVLNLSLGFSHPIAFPLPQGVRCEIPADSKGTLLILTGVDKEVMGQTAAKIRGFRPPEPYGGKGVRYQGEKVREKAGKAAKAGGGK